MVKLRASAPSFLSGWSTIGPVSSWRSYLSAHLCHFCDWDDPVRDDEKQPAPSMSNQAWGCAWPNSSEERSLRSSPCRQTHGVVHHIKQRHVPNHWLREWHPLCAPHQAEYLERTAAFWLVSNFKSSGGALQCGCWGESCSASQASASSPVAHSFLLLHSHNSVLQRNTIPCLHCRHIPCHH